MLEPLKQFICDGCGQLITTPKEGYVEWRRSRTDSKVSGFKVVHHFPYSPLNNAKVGCYIYRGLQSNLPLDSFLGGEGMARILSLLEVGVYHSPDNIEMEISDLRDFVEFVRRVTIPYYEEARLYLQSAIKDGHTEGMSEVYFYLPQTLKRIIEKYGNKIDG